MVVGLRDRLDFVGNIATAPRPDPFVAPEVFLEEGLVVLDIAAKRPGELSGVVEIEVRISMSNRDVNVDYSTVEKVHLLATFDQRLDDSFAPRVSRYLL